jgi:hypothetical protein
MTPNPKTNRLKGLNKKTTLRNALEEEFTKK